MNLSASGLFFGLVIGILGVWLFLQFAERQHTDYRVHESRVACDKARFDLEFSPRNEALKAREKAACGDLDAQVAARTEQEEKAKRENAELKKSIEKALNDEKAQAEVIAAAASSVVSTVKTLNE